ncbi:MAG: NfeD domain-containing protein [Burkholderia sp.]|jgi:membrane protein implicated in regulation of membrane protease activity
MSLSATVLWFIAALVAAGVEMFLGTVYLLAVAAACAGGGLVSFLGFGTSWQLTAAAVIIVAGIWLVHRFRRHKEDRSSELQQMDSGQTVSVEKIGEDGFATVNYRGAPWTARAAEGQTLSPGLWRIERVDGTQLVLTK